MLFFLKAIVHINIMQMSIFMHYISILMHFLLLKNVSKNSYGLCNRNLFDVKSKMMYDKIYLTFGTKEKIV